MKWGADVNPLKRSYDACLGGAWLALLPGAVSRSWAICAWLNDAELQRFKDATLDRPLCERQSFSPNTTARTAGSTTSKRGMTLRGHWSITQGTLCTIYDFDETGGCYRVSARRYELLRILFRLANGSRPRRVLDGKPRWTARGAIQGQPSACQDEPSV